MDDKTARREIGANKSEKILIFQHFLVFVLEAPSGVGPMIRVLQTRALPLG